MPLLKTRYRDIPEDKLEHRLYFVSNWEACRKLIVEIKTPPIDNSAAYGLTCQGPHYYIHSINGKDVLKEGYLACPHIVEIGD